MSNDCVARNDGPKFVPPPEDTYSSVLCGCWNLGTQHTSYAGKPKIQHQVYLLWQIDHRKEDGTRYTVGKTYTLSLYEKAGFRKLLEGWYGTKITKEQEDKGIDPRKLLGGPGLLQVIHKQTDDKVWANIGAVTKLMKGMEPLKVEGKQLSFSFGDDGLNIPEGTPKFVTEMIQKSDNWRILQGQANKSPSRSPDNNDDSSEGNFAPDDSIEEPPF